MKKPKSNSISDSCITASAYIVQYNEYHTNRMHHLSHAPHSSPKSRSQRISNNKNLILTRPLLETLHISPSAKPLLKKTPAPNPSTYLPQPPNPFIQSRCKDRINITHHPLISPQSKPLPQKHNHGFKSIRGIAFEYLLCESGCAGESV